MKSPLLPQHLPPIVPSASLASSPAAPASASASCLTPVWDKACRRSSSASASSSSSTAAASEDWSESSEASWSSLSLSSSWSASLSPSPTLSPAPSLSLSLALSPDDGSALFPPLPPPPCRPSPVAVSVAAAAASPPAPAAERPPSPDADGASSPLPPDDTSRDLILKLLGDVLQDKRRTAVQRSLELLSQLCYRHAHAHRHRVFALQAGGCVAVLHALRRFDHVALHTAAVQVLLNLSQVPSARALVAATGGIPLLLHSLRKHRKTSFLHLCGCGVLAELACDPSAARELLKHRGPAQLVDSMASFPDNRRLQEGACQALYRLSALGVPPSTLLAVPGCVSALAQALERHSNDPAVRRSAHLALTAILPSAAAGGAAVGGAAAPSSSLPPPFPSGRG